MTEISEKTELGLRPRLLAAGWFALTACGPILFFFLVLTRAFLFVAIFDPRDVFVTAIFIVMPLAIAAFFGFFIGSRILNDGVVTSGSKAALHGALVGILAFLGHMVAYTAMSAANTSAGLGQVVGSALAIFYVGALMVGWLVVLSGALGGWLLFRFSWNSLHAPLTTWTHRTRAIRLNWMAAAALVVVLIACWLPVRRLAQLENAGETERDLFQAVWSNDPAKVEELLAAGLSADTLSVAGTPLLIEAAENGHTRIVKMLLEHGANPNVRSINPGHRTPLHYACSNFDVGSIKALLARGADINATDDAGWTPLIIAASTTDRETVNFLIEHGADVNARNTFGNTALSSVRESRDSSGNADRSGEHPSSRLDAGRNFGDSRDHENPMIIKRARARHDAIVELLVSYGAKSQD